MRKKCSSDREKPFAKGWFVLSKIGFSAGTKVFEEALNAVKFLEWLKMFGPAHNILEPVKGQGISYQKTKKLQV